LQQNIFNLKNIIMATLTIEVDEQAVEARPFVDFIHTLGFVTVVSENKSRNKGIDAALEDVKAGRVYAAKNTRDLMQQTTA
jgi:hypothetical protein